MSRKILFLSFFLLFAAFYVHGQTRENGEAFLIKPEPDVKARFSTPSGLEEQLGLSPGNKLVLTKRTVDELGNSVESYTQSYKGVPVEHAVYKIIIKDGQATAISGEFYNIENLSVTPAMSEAAALSVALGTIGARKYSWKPAEKAPEGTLTVYAVDDGFALTWRFDIYALDPLSRDHVYVDAHSGEVRGVLPILKHAEGTAETRYSGSRNIETLLMDGVYTLRDHTRGNGIETYDLNRGTTYSNAVDFTDADNNWTAAEFDNEHKDNAALDAHFGAAQTYDYFLQEHGRNSFDDNGAKVLVYVHFGQDYINAFWDGYVLTFGDGGVDFDAEYDPLTTIDIVAHEFGHALCQYTADLVYAYEPGALNESLSDIWGATIKHWTDPSKNYWLNGDETNHYFRSMENPNERDQPDTYQGDFWFEGEWDNGGVHINSGVMNHWYYLLVEGGAGVNDHGHGFSVEGIGFDDAAQIVYRAETIYLTPNSDYEDARVFTLQAAEDIFGAGSREALQSAAAWDAVGVYDMASIPGNLAAFVTEDEDGVYVNLSWTDNSDWETGFEVYRSEGGDDLPAAIDTTEANAESYTDHLPAEGGSFTYSVRAISDDQLSAFSNTVSIVEGASVVNMTDGDFSLCSGILLDPGGQDNYPNGSYVTMTLSPAEEGKYVSLSFEEFNTESCCDYLYVFEGPDMASPLLGSFYGSIQPGVITSGAGDGSLTLHFNSDGSVTGEGFMARIGCVDSVPEADLSFAYITLGTPAVLPGQAVEFQYNIQNLGERRAAASAVGLFLSSDDAYDSADVLLESWSISSVGAGGSYGNYRAVSVPDSTDAGDYHLFFVADYGDNIIESNEENNILAEELEVAELEVDAYAGNLTMPSSLAAGNRLGLSLDIYNAGNHPIPSVDVSFYVSSDSIVNEKAVLLGSKTSNRYIYSSTEMSASVKIPDTLAAGNYYFVVEVDPEDELSETDETNNSAYLPFTVDPFGSYFIMPYNASNVISVCSGLLYDHGGRYENYSNDARDTLTIYPGEPGKYVRLDFQSFNLYYSSDYLRVFNGESTQSPAFGQFSADNKPPTIYSSDSSGALTLVFYSNYYGSADGFIAEISCIDEIPQPDLAIGEFSVDDPIIVKEDYVDYSFTLANEEAVPVANVPYSLYMTSDSLGLADRITLAEGEASMVWLQPVQINETFIIDDSVDQGTKFLWVEVNPDREIDEQDYGNNKDYQGVIVVDRVVDLAVVEASPSIDNPYPGGNIAVNTTIKNKGAVGSPDTRIGFYISRDSVFDNDATLLEYVYLYGIAPGSFRNFETGMYLPDTLELGNWFIHVKADYENQIEELTESNNLYSFPVEISEPVRDLEVISFTISPAVIQSTDYVEVSATIRNNGNHSVNDARYIHFYISDDQLLDEEDIFFSQTNSYTSWQPQRTYEFNFSIRSTAAIPPGDKYLILSVDDDNNVEETNEENNTMAARIVIEETLIDISAEKNGEWPERLYFHNSTSFSASFTNNGNVDLGYVSVGLALSEDSLLSDDDYYLDYWSLYDLRDGATASVYFDVFLYDDLQPGSYYLIASPTFEWQDDDLTPQNNNIVHSIELAASEYDYSVSSMSTGGEEFYQGEPIPITVVIKNAGPEPSLRGNYLELLASPDSTFNSAQQLYFNYIEAMEANDSIEFTYYTYQLFEEGTLYLRAQIGGREEQETDKTNNTYTTSVLIIQGEETRVPESGSQTIFTCSTLITDAGGVAGSYYDDSDGLLTIYPEQAGDMVQLMFTSFELEICCDYLEIYDGESTSAALIGRYADVPPGVIEATNESGALTLRFYSDGSIAYSGFSAQASCVSVYRDAPDLQVNHLDIGNEARLSAGAPAKISLALENAGLIDAMENEVEIFLSTDNTISAGDVYLGSFEVVDIAPHEGLNIEIQINVPKTLSEGEYYLIARARGQMVDGAPLEENLDNNQIFVKVTVENAKVGAPLSVDEDLNFRIYPNPLGKDRALAIHSGIFMEVEVYNATGLLVKTGKIQAGENLMPLPDLKSGVYLMRFRSRSATFMERLIIN